MKRKWKDKFWGYAFIILMGFALFQSAKDSFVKYFGETVPALITMVPKKCEKYGFLHVQINNTDYSLSYNRIRCENKNYHTGLRIEVRKHSWFNKILWPDESPEWRFAVFLGALLLLMNVRSIIKVISGNNK